jgi:hypothetical protein
MYYIYYLEQNNIPFYIGRTISPTSRKRDHIKRFGPTTNMIIIDEVEEDDFWEIYYMWLFKSWGFDLSNKSFKAFGPDKVSEETKSKISIGVKQNLTRNNKISKANKGKYIGRKAPWASGIPKGAKYTEEQKQKMRKPRINKWRRPSSVDPSIIFEIQTLYNNKQYNKTQLHIKYKLSQDTIRNIVDKKGIYE